MSNTIPRNLKERQALTKVLKKYKNSPCLWDLTDKNYYQNKTIKASAWEEVLKIWQKFDPTAILYDVKSKIFHMRTNYTRHRKKIENMAVGKDYKPSLWYYKYLTFLSGDNDDSDQNSNSSSDETDETQYVRIPPGQKRRASNSVDLDTESEATGAVDTSAVAFGQSVGAQLQNLDKIQRCIAEKLISDVIYHAKMDQLTMNSSINVSQPQPIDATSMIPESEPSWYEQESSSSCTFQVEEDVTSAVSVQETDTAASLIKQEFYG